MTLSPLHLYNSTSTIHNKALYKMHHSFIIDKYDGHTKSIVETNKCNEHRMAKCNEFELNIAMEKISMVMLLMGKPLNGSGRLNDK